MISSTLNKCKHNSFTEWNLTIYADRIVFIYLGMNTNQYIDNSRDCDKIQDTSLGK